MPFVVRGRGLPTSPVAGGRESFQVQDGILKTDGCNPLLNAHCAFAEPVRPHQPPSRSSGSTRGTRRRGGGGGSGGALTLAQVRDGQRYLTARWQTHARSGLSWWLLFTAQGRVLIRNNEYRCLAYL